MDDHNFMCMDKLVERVLQHTQVYGVVAGSKLNVGKSTYLAMGKSKDLSILDISVPRDPELKGQKI